MRRGIGYAAFCVGWILLFLAPLGHLYVSPRIEKAPIDVFRVTRALGTGLVLSPEDLRLDGPIALEGIVTVRSDPRASGERVGVYTRVARTFDPRTGETISQSHQVIAIDRTTGEPVHCCGERPRHDGLTLMFPAGTRPFSYRYYDETIHGSFPATYLRTESVAGLPTLVFQVTVPDTPIGRIAFPRSLVEPGMGGVVSARHWYRSTATLWVESLTGAIVKTSQVTDQWATHGDRTVATLSHSDLVETDDSVARTAVSIRDRRRYVRLFRFWIPFVGPAAGMVSIVAGAVLLRTIGNREPRGVAVAEAVA